VGFRQCSFLLFLLLRNTLLFFLSNIIRYRYSYFSLIFFLSLCIVCVRLFDMMVDGVLFSVYIGTILNSNGKMENCTSFCFRF